MIENLPINLTDLLVIAVIAISALFAFVRGLVREVLSVAAWVAAVLATFYGLPLAKPFLREYISFTLLADTITGVSIFLVTLIICSAISHFLSRNVRGSAFGALDRSLGLLFGVARGALLLSFGYLLMAWAIPEDERPGWITEARSLPLVVVGADWLQTVMPESAAKDSAIAANATKRQIERAAKAEELLSDFAAPEPALGETETPRNPDVPEEGSGYKDDERNQMDRLFQGAQ
ncbi:CvpA family protein [Rhodospirillaceae bacterium SYSU D60014]|uniref:CvpA family protein n=1 Tax=Virgifigura deserti TaxID=2268457 RepID=UPI000E663B14